MATKEELIAAEYDTALLLGIQRSMITNPLQYKRRLAAGEDPAEVAKIAKDNAAWYQIHLSGRQAVRADPEKATVLAAGLAAGGIDQSANDDLLATLKAQADVETNVELKDSASIEAMSDAAIEAVKVVSAKSADVAQVKV